MSNPNKANVFCLTSYKKWLGMLAVLVVILVVWIAVGINEDGQKNGMNRITRNSEKIENQIATGKEHFDIFDTHIEQMAQLQESYSDIAIKMKAVTVNISATVNGPASAAPNNGFTFSDPFSPSPQNMQGQGGAINTPSVIGVKITAPPITANAKMPHRFRGVCSNCHTIKKNTALQNIVVPGRTSIGSGFIIDSQGFIVTNYHIIKNANDIIVTTATNNKYRAEVKYTDIQGDMAILKVNSTTPFPAAPLGDSDLVQTGDIVIAVGNPFGLNQTVTSGIISNTNRNVTIGGRQFTNLIQTDAAINRGSSGGPLVNIKGEVIGINTAIYSITGDFTGVGFAIPINRPKETFPAIPTFQGMMANIIDLNVGEVITVAAIPNVPDAWFGAEVSPIDPIMAAQFGLGPANGVLVNQIFSNSPAEESGLLRGDVIQKINSRRITGTDKFQKVTSPLTPGSEIRLSVLRDNQKIKLTALLAIRPKGVIKRKPRNAAAAGPTEFEFAGLEIVPMNPKLGLKFGIQKGTRGVIVLEAEGMAAAAGVMMGDLIKGVNRQKITNMMDFVNAVPNVNLAEGVLFDIQRQGEPLFITM